ncbi:MAG TPA: DUF2071 domain-containing protein [Acidimicrobiia bacterium]
MGRLVRAEVVTRYVFNFRMSPAEAAAMLPVPWLEPAIVDGSAILSFCPYVLRRLTVGRLPAWLGLDSICAAYRLAVVEDTPDGPRPAVWVPGRSSSSAIVAWGARRWIHTPRFDRISEPRSRRPGVLEYVRPGAAPFRAVLGSEEHSPGCGSHAFAGEREFGCFMDAGTSSLAPGRRAGELVRIDLDLRGTRWAALPVVEVVDELVPEGAAFESAFVGRGGTYTWWLAGDMPVGRRATQVPQALVPSTTRSGPK